MQTDSDDTAPAKLGAILDCLPHPAIVVAPDLTVESVNQRFRSLYGSDEEVLGHPCHEVLHGSSRPCDLTGEECPVQTSHRSGRVRRTLHVHLTPRGLEHVEVTVRPVHDSSGKVTSFVESLRPSTLASAEPARDRLVGRAPAFRRMLEKVERVARHDSPVLLDGEPGSGREAVALALHRTSPRSAGPFVPMDCAGAREPWSEMELFGTACACDTSESAPRPGLIEAANDGTVYLNEIGELPLAAQARLLRTLETGTVRHVGGSQPIVTNFRLICSTSTDLRELIHERRFVTELQLRIGELTVRVPPLRERLDDLELLIETQLRQLEESLGCRLGDGTLTALSSYHFPGNLRELATLLQRACVLAQDGVILPEDFPQRIGQGGGPRRAPLEIDRILSFAELERCYINWACRRGEDRRSLARCLGCSERTLQRKLQKLES